MSSENSTRFAVLDASGSNWHTWQTTAKFELKSQKVWKYFDPANPSSIRPPKFSTDDQVKFEGGTDPETLTVTAAYTSWIEEADVAIARLARLVDPIHADILNCSSIPKECWDALVVRFARQSTQGVTLIQTRLAALKFPDDNSVSLTDFIAEFNGLVLDLKRAGYPLSPSETCARLALAMPLSLQSMVSTLQEGRNSANPDHWYSALATTWERLKSVSADESTYAAKRAAISAPSSSSRDTCHVCHNPGHFARDCPTLTPEERARRQERSRKRKEARSANRPADKTPDLAAQLAQIQARLAALDTRPSRSDDTASGYDAQARVTILCASVSSLSSDARVECLERSVSGELVLKTGGGKVPRSYAAIDSGASRHCASERAFFANYRELAEPRRVYLGDDHFIMAVGEGDLRVWVDRSSGEREGLVFTRTLHVPDLACTLISIRQLTRDVRPNVHAVFQGDFCEIRNDRGLIFRATADDSAGGLYALHLRTAPRPALRTPVLALAAFVASKSTTQLDPHIAHARFGHLNCNDLNALVRKQLVSNLSLSDRIHHSDPCEPCLLSKAHKLPFSPRATRSSTLLDLVHTDVCGPMDVEAIGGFRYFITFRDDCTRMLKVYLLKKKSDALERYKEFRAWAERSSGRKIKCLMSDRGGEFMSDAFECFLRDTGTVNQTSSPYTPEQNGSAERVNRDVLSIMRSGLQDSGLARRFWGEAVLYAAYTLNFRPNSALDGRLPYTAWTGDVPDVSHLRSFGCDAYVLVQPESKREKTGPTAAKCLFTGYTGSGYRCWDPKMQRFRDSRHVVCVEQTRRGQQLAPVSPPSESAIRQAFGLPSISSSPQPSQVTAPAPPRIVDLPLDEPDSPDMLPSTFNDEIASNDHPEDSSDAEELGEVHSDHGEDPEPETSPEPDTAPEDPGPRRGTRIRKPNPQYAHVAAAIVSPNQPVVPSSYREAMAGPDAGLWMAASAKEVETLIRKGTFSYAKTLPPGRKALRGMFVFAIKVDGTHKARLVVKGCAQRFGQDYTQTFSPVARSASLRLVVAVAVRDGLTLYAADFTAAFLNGMLQEEIYMEQPEGWVSPPDEQGSYLRLVRSLYGLKQAGRVWYECLTSALAELGFTQFNSDNCVFMRRRQDTGLILLAVHVDDLTGAASNDQAWNLFCDELNAKYELKNLGRAKEILGLEISQDHQAGTASITQTRYIEDLAKRYDVYDRPPLSLPLPPGQRCSRKQCPDSDEGRTEMKGVPYLALVGALLFVCCQTRPDISHSVCTLARFSANPGRVHWEALLGVLQYLRHTSKLGLSYSRSGSRQLSIYSDADWGMCPDTYKSTTGWLVALSAGLVSWCSKLQSVVAQSTMEAEYVAMSMACREGYWVRSWLAELDCLEPDKRPGPTPLFCDNRAAIAVAMNPESHQMTKHIAIRYHYVREQVAEGEYVIYHVPSHDQVADFLTKPTSKEVFLRCRARAGIC